MERFVPWLFGYLVVREVYFLYSTHKLINKLMSRNYYDYMITQKATRTVEKEPKPETPDTPEDFGAMNEFV